VDDRPAIQLTLEASPLLGPRAAVVYAVFIVSLTLPGDAAECGVWEGHTAHEMGAVLKFAGVNKRLHLFDTFTGMPDIATPEELAIERPQENWAQITPGSILGTEEIVRERMAGLPYRLYRGLFSETFPSFDTPLCFIHADADLYASTVDIIRMADRLLVPQGYIVFDDYDSVMFPGVMRAVREYLDPGRYDFWKPKEDDIQLLARKVR